MSRAEPSDVTGIRNYQLLALLGLATLVLLPLQQPSYHIGAAGPVVVGGLCFATALCGLRALYARREMSPLYALAIAAALQFLLRNDVRRWGNLSWQDHPLDPFDLAISLAGLAYIAGAYRHHALRHRPLPPDRRRPAPTAPRWAEPAEFVGLLLTIPLYVLAAQAVWWLAGAFNPWLDLPSSVQRGVVLVWALELVALVAALGFRTWRRRQMSATAARLLLQDILWRETRGEQRRIARWLAWLKIKRADERNT